MGHTQAHRTEDYLRFIAEIVGKYKERTYELMKLAAGHNVMDLGCGPGTDTVALGQLVGETGTVMGIDRDAGHIARADEKAQAAGMAGWVHHRVADASDLPFADDTFDASRSERLFHHLPQAEPALAEMVRVTKPGGWIVLLDTDWGSTSTATSEVDIVQRLSHFHATHGFANGYAGRELLRMVREQGLINIHIEMAPIFITDLAISRRGAMMDETEEAALAAGVITQEELDRLHRDLEARDRAGHYFAFANQVLVAAQKA